MAPSKHEPSSYHYDPLPPDLHHQTHNQTRHYIFVPVYISSRLQTRCRRPIIYTLSLLLLAVALFFLWPSDPQLSVARFNLDRLHIRTKPSITLDITLDALVKVRNPDFYSMDFNSLRVTTSYRGRQLGFVNSDNGHVKARGSSYINATLVLDGVEILSDVFFLIEDLARGSIPFDTVSEVRGFLGFFFFKLPLKAKVSCEIYVSTKNHTITHQNCRPE